MKIFHKIANVLYYVLIAPVLIHILWKLCDKYYKSFATLKSDYKTINTIPTTKMSWLVSLISGIIVVSVIYYGNMIVLGLIEELMKEPSLQGIQGILYEMQLQGPIAAFLILSVFFAPLYEEVIKYIIIKTKIANVNSGFAIVVFIIFEFVLYATNIEISGVNLPPEVIIGFVIGVCIARIVPILMHMKTIHILQNDGLLASIRYHFLWNLIVGRVFMAYIGLKMLGHGIKRLWAISVDFIKCFHR